jgi:hypothetical protein
MREAINQVESAGNAFTKSQVQPLIACRISNISAEEERKKFFQEHPYSNTFAIYLFKGIAKEKVRLTDDFDWIKKHINPDGEIRAKWLNNGPFGVEFGIYYLTDESPEQVRNQLKSEKWFNDWVKNLRELSQKCGNIGQGVSIYVGSNKDPFPTNIGDWLIYSSPIDLRVQQRTFQESLIECIEESPLPKPAKHWAEQYTSHEPRRILSLFNEMFNFTELYGKPVNCKRVDSYWLNI